VTQPLSIVYFVSPKCQLNMFHLLKTKQQLSDKSFRTCRTCRTLFCHGEARCC
jgi:hypothetical protein